MNSKDIGNIGEAMAIGEFIKRGIPVLQPFGDNLPYDLVVVYNNEFKKIQIKTTENIKNGAMIFNVSKTGTYKGEKLSLSYSKNDIDFFFLYCIENGMSMLFPMPNSAASAISIRIEPTKNGQVKGINMYYDYSLDKVLNMGN